MSCSCDADAPLVYTQTTPKARKPHQCCECFGIIGIGQKYERTDGLWSDGPDCFKVCMACVYVRQKLQCKCVAFGSLHEQATDEDLDFWALHKEYQP